MQKRKNNVVRQKSILNIPYFCGQLPPLNSFRTFMSQYIRPNSKKEKFPQKLFAEKRYINNLFSQWEYPLGLEFLVLFSLALKPLNHNFFIQNESKRTGAREKENQEIRALVSAKLTTVWIFLDLQIHSEITFLFMGTIVKK